MANLLSLKQLLSYCLELNSLRLVLKNNGLSVLGDNETKIERLTTSLLSGEVKFREGVLHFLTDDEIRELAFQIGMDTDDVVWKIKEDLSFWFHQRFDELSGWSEDHHLSFNNQQEIIDWISTGSLQQIRQLCDFIENDDHFRELFYKFSDIEDKKQGIERLKPIAARYLLKAIEAIFHSGSQHKDQEIELDEMSLEEAYDLLDLGPDCISTEIKRRYFDLMKRYHPDSSGQMGDENTLLLIQNAFEKIKSIRADIR